MFELVVVWQFETEPQIYEYATRELAEKAKEGFCMAFGEQCRCVVRRKV